MFTILFNIIICIFVLSIIGFVIALGFWIYVDASYLIAGKKKTEKSLGKLKKYLITAAICVSFSTPLYIVFLVVHVLGTA